MTHKALKSAKDVAQEVINGKWGNGQDRKKALEAAGYNYKEVQAIVDELMKASKKVETTPTTVTASQSAYKFDKALAGKYKTLSDLYIRDGAGTTYKTLCLIPIGTTVRCYGYYNDVNGGKWLYIQVKLNGTTYTGFSSSAYLKK